MTIIRKSSFNEYIKWYLQREVRKGNCDKVPILARNRRKLMEREHSGKLKHWYEKAIWKIIRITQDEFERIIPIESDWTKRTGLTNPSLGDNYRLLRNVAGIAIQINYLDYAERSGYKDYKEYYNQLRRGDIHLEGENRIVLRSLGHDETLGNPDAFFYLQDGWARSLPYQILLMEGHLSYEPVEAFCACKS